MLGRNQLQVRCPSLCSTIPYVSLLWSHQNKWMYNQSCQVVKALAASEALTSYMQDSLYKDCPQARELAVCSSPSDVPVHWYQTQNCCADRVLPDSGSVQSRPMWLFDLNCNKMNVNINEISVLTSTKDSLNFKNVTRFVQGVMTCSRLRKYKP